MRNHYHILIETPFGNLSKGMQYFNREFARRFNISLKRTGAVLKERYKSILIEKDEYYKNVFRYISQNPIRIGLTKNIAEYPGSLWYYLKDNKNSNLRIKINELIDWQNIYSNLGINNNKGIINWINESNEINPGKNQRFKHLWGSKKWLDDIKEKYVEKHSINSNIIGFNKLKLYNKGIWKKYKILDNYREDEDYKNIVIYLLSKYSQLTQGEIANKLEIKNSNSVSQRLYKIKKRLISDEPFKQKIIDVEKNPQESHK